MPVQRELLDRISEDEKQYSPEQIVIGLSQSEKYPDIASKTRKYLDQGYAPKQILMGIKQSEVKDKPTEKIDPFAQFDKIFF